MANQNCSACEDIRQTDPNLIVNGFSDTECASLGNDTGLVPSSGNNDCTDLKNLNDCLIGNMETELDAFDVCDWKTFMKKYIPNVWTVVEAIICAICGIWTNIHNLWEKVNCTYGALTRLVNELSSTTQGSAFVRYFRDNGTTSGFWWSLVDGEDHTVDVYMDASGENYGSVPADRDYVVQVHNCTNFLHFYSAGVSVTFYSSDDTRPIDTIRTLQAQHADLREASDSTNKINSFSWTTSGAVLVRKGQHLKVNSHVDHARTYDDDGRYRLHQFVMTWIPVNIDNEFDPSDILTC